LFPECPLLFALDPYLTLHGTFSILNVAGWNFELTIKGRAITFRVRPPRASP